MPSFRSFLLASFAVAGALSADCSGDVSIESDGDVSKLDNCNSWKGNVAIGEGVVALSIASLQTLNGDLTISGATGLTSISAPMLRSISGTWTMKELTILSSVSCASLTSVGNINWQTLPALKALDFTSGVAKCDEVLITDTILTSLNGIQLQTVTNFNINNNKYLKEVNVALGNVSNALNIEFNSKGVNVAFPDLVWAKNITIRDAGSVSFPKLESVNGTIAFINNTFTDAAFPELTEVGGSFAFNSNSQLSNVSAVNLETIGGTFQLANNTKLTDIDGFPALTTVDGSVDFSGSFTNATLPALDDVRGGMNIQTTEEFDCTEFDNYKSDGVVKGNGYTCEGKLDEAKSSSGGSSTSGSGNSSDNTSSAARAGVSIVALFAACAAMLVL